MYCQAIQSSEHLRKCIAFREVIEQAKDGQAYTHIQTHMLRNKIKFLGKYKQDNTTQHSTIQHTVNMFLCLHMHEYLYVCVCV